MNYKIGFKYLVVVTIYLISMVLLTQGDEGLSCYRCYWRETKPNGTVDNSTSSNNSDSGNNKINNSSETLSGRSVKSGNHHTDEHDDTELEAQKLCEKGESTNSSSGIRLGGKCPKNTTYCFKASGSSATSNAHIILRGCAFDWMERKREGEGWRFVVEERARIYGNMEKGEEEREIHHMGHTHKKNSDLIAMRVFEAWTYYCNTSYCNDSPDFDESPKKKKKGLFGIGSSAQSQWERSCIALVFLPIFLLLFFNRHFFHDSLIHKLRQTLIS